MLVFVGNDPENILLVTVSETLVALFKLMLAILLMNSVLLILIELGEIVDPYTAVPALLLNLELLMLVVPDVECWTQMDVVFKVLVNTFHSNTCVFCNGYTVIDYPICRSGTSTDASRG